MQYLELCELYDSLEKTSKRLEKTYYLADFLKKTPDEDIPVITLLIQGRLFPLWDSRELGVADKLIIKAIAKATGKEVEKINDFWREIGDLGNVAEHLGKKKSQSTLFSKKLDVKKVFTNLQKLAGLVGQGTVDQKVGLIAELLTSAEPLEARYIVRTTLNDLRVGVGDGSIRDAIVWSSFDFKYDKNGITWEDEKTERVEYNRINSIVENAYNLLNDFSEVALIARKGEKKLVNVELKIGNPIKVMLAQKAQNISEAFETVGKPAQFEFKMDGFRMQIHKKDDFIQIFTRNLEDVTDQFPEVVDYIKKVKAKSFILDAEAVGFNPKTKKYLPFQKISQRVKRKYDIEKVADEFPVEVNVFDMLYLEGKNLINEQFEERRRLIEKVVPSIDKKIIPARKIVTDSEEKAKKFYEDSLSSGNEGLMAKKMDAPYKPGSRVGYMLKLKPTMETLDLAIVGAEWGEGKRANWLTSYTLACKQGDEFLEIGKLGTGIKEKEDSEGGTFTHMTEILQPLITEQKGKEIKVKPKVIIEVKYEEIQASPTYSSGFALRFPRMVRVRDDKGLDDISTLKDIKKAYELQRGRS